MIPAPRPASDPPLRPAPFRLPWSQTRVACRPVIGDALLLQYPEVAKALAERSRSEEAVRCLEAQAGGLCSAEIHRRTGIVWRIIADVAAGGGA